MKIFKKMDILIIICLVGISFLPHILFAKNLNKDYDSVYAIIKVDGKTYKEIPLSSLKEDDSVQYQIRKEPLLQIVVNKIDTYRIREDIELSGNKPNISEILWNTVTLNNINTKLYVFIVKPCGEINLTVFDIINR